MAEKFKTKQLQMMHPGLKVNDQLVAYATRFLAVRLKNHVWSHLGALKAKVQCDFSGITNLAVLTYSRPRQLGQLVAVISPLKITQL